MSQLHAMKKKAEATGPGFFSKVFKNGENPRPAPAANDPLKGEGCKSRKAKMRRDMIRTVKAQKRGDSPHAM